MCVFLMESVACLIVFNAVSRTSPAYLDRTLLEQIVRSLVTLPLCTQEGYPESGHYLAKSMEFKDYPS